MRKMSNSSDTKWGRLLSTVECQQYLGVGYPTMIKITEKAGAKRNFGKRVLYDRNKIDEYLDSLD